MSQVPPSEEESLKKALDDLEFWPTEQVVAQLIMPSVGHDVQDRSLGAGHTDITVEDLKEAQFGSVCYFSGDAAGATPRVVAQRVHALRAVSDLPLLVSIDQENGLITRMREPATRITSAMGQTAADDWDAVEDLAAVTGRELRAVGIDFAFAPIADVNSEPDNPVIGLRSPGSSPQVVAQFDRSVIEGLRSAGVASCAKHFPGHGSTHVDSHVGLPVLDITLEEWRRSEAIPFAASIEAGVDSVMVGHLTAPNLDPTMTPATYSRPIVTGLLRGELGFEGVIVTDALDMEGARLDGPPGEEAIAALAAGCDVAVMPSDPIDVLNDVCEAVDEGRLDLEELRASARRVLELKLRLQTTEAAMSEFDMEKGDPESQSRADAQARQSLTWRDPSVTWKLPAAPARVLVIQDRGPLEEGRGTVDTGRELSKHLGDAGYQVTFVEFTDGQVLTDYVQGPDPADAVLLITRDSWRREGDAQIIEDLDREVDCVVCARSPYDAALVGETKPVLLAFGDLPQTPAAVFDALATGAAGGVLPVDLLDGHGEIRWKRRV